MPAPILTTTSTIMCPHGGQLQLVTSDVLFQIQGGFALLVTDVHPIVGCPFTVGIVYTPCVLARWIAPATQTAVQSVPVLLMTSVGICYSAVQAPQGVAIVVQTQQLAMGT